jgi:predicted amidohydrolase
MQWSRSAWVALIGTGLLLVGCRGDGPDPGPNHALDHGGAPSADAAVADGPAVSPTDDSGLTPSDGPASPPSDTWTTPPPPKGSIVVGAVQYGPDSYTYVPGCSKDKNPNNCGLKHFITQAKKQGAQYVSIPEYSLDYEYLQPDPVPGDKPATDAKWGLSSPVGMMAKLADDLDIHLIFDVQTYTGSGASEKMFQTHIVVDPKGTVLKTHHKYYLIWNEKTDLTAGTNCCDTFDTPAGKAALMLCADANCIPYMDSSKSSCTAYGLKKLNEFLSSKQRTIVFFSAAWMAWKANIWKAKNVMSKLAKLGQVYVVGANWIDGKYHGGGVWAPNGSALVLKGGDTSKPTPPPSVAIATIPKGGTTPPPPTSGPLVITEFMANPAAVADSKGEWFEVYNAGKGAVDLKGWTIEDASGSHTVKSSVTVGAGTYVALGVNDSSGANGGAPVAYDYGSLSLANSGDTIKLVDGGGKVVDQISYTSSWGVASGASLSLKSTGLDNAVGSSWCVETSPWTGSAGDKGTPGAPAGCK